MTKTVAELAELIRQEIVLQAPDASIADGHLRDLIRQLQLMLPNTVLREASWAFCTKCGTSVDVDLIHLEGHHYNSAGDFYCADCWETGEPPV